MMISEGSGMQADSIAISAMTPRWPPAAIVATMNPATAAERLCGMVRARSAAATARGRGGARDRSRHRQPPLLFASVLTRRDRRPPLLAPHFVDDLQHAFAIRTVLNAELLDEAAIVDQIIAGDFFAAALLVETDPGVRQVFAYNVGDLAEADRDAAGIVDPVLGMIGHDYPGEDFGDLVDMDRAAHRVLERE